MLKIKHRFYLNFTHYGQSTLFKMVEVFKTNIDNKQKSDFFLGMLKMTFPECNIHFDLEDCDNILRIETQNKAFEVARVIELVTGHGFQIEVLPDYPVTGLLDSI